MALDVLAQGKLTKAPEQRTASNGKPFALAQLAIAMDEGDVLASVIAFRTEAVDALLALGKGDACAVVGRGKVGTWTNRDGETRPSLSITADGVLSVYHVRRKRTAAQGDEGASDDAPHSPTASRAPAGRAALPVATGSAVAAMADDIPY